MSHRRALILAFILLASLACNLIPAENDPVPPKVLSVSVSPTKGSGPFTGTVVYMAGDVNSGIKCVWNRGGTGGGGEEIFPVMADPNLKSEQDSHTFTFNLTEPGEYQMACWDTYINERKATTFAVTGSEVSLEPTKEGSEQKNQKYTHAKITFDLSQIQFNTTPVGGITDGWLLGYCWPPEDFQNNGKGFFTVDEAGVLVGACSVETSSDNIVGSITGSYDAETNSLSFNLTTSHIFNGSSDGSSGSIDKVVFDGSTSTIQDGVATGIAQFTVTCNAHGGTYCIDEFQDLTYTGTVPFTLTLLP